MGRLLWKTADRIAVWWELKFGSDITIQILALAAFTRQYLSKTSSTSPDYLPREGLIKPIVFDFLEPFIPEHLLHESTAQVIPIIRRGLAHKSGKAFRLNIYKRLPYALKEKPHPNWMRFLLVINFLVIRLIQTWANQVFGSVCLIYPARIRT